MDKNICTIILELLNEGNLSQIKLAKLLGTNKSLITHWMNGYRRPSVNQCYRLIKIAKKYDIELTLEMLKPEEDDDHE